MGKQNRTHNIRPADGPKGDEKNVREEIRKLAYELFCECGCEQGHDLMHWGEAERRVLGRVKDKQER